MESIPTSISILGELYEQKGPIRELVGKLTEKWFGRKSRLVITGMAGVGKTTLLDCLSGRVFAENYVLPNRSTRVERATRTLPANALRDEPKMHIAYSVIPGQPSLPRQIARKELFDGKTDIVGIVHVVSSGLPTLRYSASQLVAINTIADYRAYYLAQELVDLDETCHDIERYLVASRKTVWLLLTLNKIDLFHQTLDLETAIYTSDDSPFVQRLRALQNRVGSLNFRWEVVPVCSWLEDFGVGESRLRSNLSQTEFRQYLQAFLTKLITNC